MAYANASMRCGANIIVLGASKNETFRKCGTDYIEQISGAFDRCSEKWYYDFGPENFP